MTLSIRLLGRFDVQVDGEPVTGFRSNKARLLLAYLAVEANQPIPRSTLATLLWGGYPNTDALRSLRNTIANLRQILPSAVTADSLLVNRQTVQLLTHNTKCTVDVAKFDGYIRSAKNVISSTDSVDLLTDAVALYQGDLLADLPVIDAPEFEDWRLVQQEERHRQMMIALNTLSATASQQNDHLSAAQYARRQIQLEPWQERAHQQLMQSLYAQGDRTAALAQFETLRKILDSELGIEPSAETFALCDLIRGGELRSQSISTEQLTETPGPPSAESAHLHSTPTNNILSRLDPLPDQKLFGIERAKARLADALHPQSRPWLIAIDGIGGIGKTTLATILIHQLLAAHQSAMKHQKSWDGFTNFAWVSAKQEEYRASTGLSETERPALDVDSLANGLLEQLMEQPPLTANSDEKRAILMQLLKAGPILVVVDNLETVADYQALVPFLRQLANPAKFLITTRFSLQSYSDIFCYSLTELSEADALAFLHYEAETRNMSRLINASDIQLQEIYHVVGGNPLALKLVIGQLSFLSLSQILENLRDARGKRIDQLYAYIYWQAWEMLDDKARQLFLTMPLTDNATFADLALTSGLELDDVQESLPLLINLSLVMTSGDLDEPRYKLHRLTETFLMNEVLKWQTLPES